MLAACLTVPTMPLPLWVFRELRFAPLEREEPFPEREALLRARLVREDPLAFVFEPELLDELLLLCPLREADLLLAVLISILLEESVRVWLPALYAHNRNLLVFQS